MCCSYPCRQHTCFNAPFCSSLARPVLIYTPLHVPHTSDLCRASPPSSYACAHTLTFAHTHLTHTPHTHTRTHATPAPPPQGGIDAFFKYEGRLGCWFDEALGTHMVAGACRRWLLLLRAAASAQGRAHTPPLKCPGRLHKPAWQQGAGPGWVSHWGVGFGFRAAAPLHPCCPTPPRPQCGRPPRRR